MSKEKWNEQKSRSFVISYLQKPSLWDSSCSEYCQKKEKERSYGELQNEFGLTLIEVRNKIRIFRTTYNQEKKKEDTVPNYKPKLNWFQSMKTAFEGGKVRSFSRSPLRSKLEMKKEKDTIIQYEYDDSIQIQRDEEIDEQVKQSDHQIIIEPYDDYEEEDEEQHFQIAKAPKEFDDHQNQRIPMSNNNQQQQPLLSSNELFLQSLKSTLDQLPAEKNMRARISIQEILYKIMYEK